MFGDVPAAKVSISAEANAGGDFREINPRRRSADLRGSPFLAAGRAAWGPGMFAGYFGCATRYPPPPRAVSAMLGAWNVASWFAEHYAAGTSSSTNE
jgi:hypothetical protein